LYPATLLKLLRCLELFCVEFFGSLRYRIMSSANRNTWTISLPIHIPFISFYCLIAWLGIPWLCWIEVGKVGNFFSFLTLWEIVSFFLH
jgi:hypothetical protein